MAPVVVFGLDSMRLDLIRLGDKGKASPHSIAIASAGRPRDAGIPTGAYDSQARVT